VSAVTLPMLSMRVVLARGIRDIRSGAERDRSRGC
jgi:hypothetical protein